MNTDLNIIATIHVGNGGGLIGTPIFEPQTRVEHWERKPLKPKFAGAPWGSVTLYAWSDGIVTWTPEREA